MVDLGGSLAVASRGLFATGVSTDLSGMFRRVSFVGLGWGKFGCRCADVMVTSDISRVRRQDRRCHKGGSYV
jgi:hypothetical protein